MRWILLSLVIALSASGLAQRVQIKSGTVLVYKVDDAGKKYIYNVSVKEFNDSVVQLQWNVNAPIAYKGESINASFGYKSAERLMIKPKMEAKELLDEGSLRLIAPGYICEDLFMGIDSLEYGIDGADALLVALQGGTKVKTINYNQQSVYFEYKEYRDKDLGVRVGFLPYGAKGYCVFYYKDENLTMELVDIRDAPGR